MENKVLSFEQHNVSNTISSAINNSYNDRTNAVKLDFSYELQAQLMFLHDHLKANNLDKLTADDIIKIQNSLVLEFKEQKMAWDAGLRPFNFELLIEEDVFNTFSKLDKENNAFTETTILKMQNIIQQKRDSLLIENPDLTLDIVNILVSPESPDAKNMYIAEIQHIVNTIKDSE